MPRVMVGLQRSQNFFVSVGRKELNTKDQVPCNKIARSMNPLPSFDNQALLPVASAHCRLAMGTSVRVESPGEVSGGRFSTIDALVTCRPPPEPSFVRPLDVV
jgi:hypothetical protein